MLGKRVLSCLVVASPTVGRVIGMHLEGEKSPHVLKEHDVPSAQFGILLVLSTGFVNLFCHS